MAEISPAMTREYKETLVVPQFEFDRPSRTEASRHDCPMYAASRFLVLFGAACLTVVVLTHVAEMFGIFPGMGWGMPNSAGHYLDLVSAAETVKSASAPGKFSAEARRSVSHAIDQVRLFTTAHLSMNAATGGTASRPPVDCATLIRPIANAPIIPFRPSGAQP